MGRFEVQALYVCFRQFGRQRIKNAFGDEVLLFFQILKSDFVWFLWSETKLFIYDCLKSFFY